jgi:hypothetical protein
LWLRLGQVATHGHAPPHEDGVSPWVVEGWLLLGGGCWGDGNHHHQKRRGSLRSMEVGTTEGSGHDSFPLEEAIAVSELEATSTPMVISSSNMSLQTP